MGLLGDDLPWTAEDIAWLEGSPDTLRSCALDLRSIAENLDAAWDACHDLVLITNGTSWSGAGFDTFRTQVERNPQPGDIDNARTTMRDAATALETLATGLDDCQARIGWCRQRVTTLSPTDGDITDETVTELEAIKSDADQAHTDYRGHLHTTQDTFAQLTDAAIYAQPPPSLADRATDTLHTITHTYTSVWAGVIEGSWEMIQGVAALVALSYQPWKWDDAYHTLREIVAYAVDHPGDFWAVTWRAAVDWETLKQDPARWVGKLIPGILLAVATGGAGSTATSLTRIAVLAGRFSRLARLTTKLDDAARLTHTFDNTFAILRPDHVIAATGLTQPLTALAAHLPPLRWFNTTTTTPPNKPTPATSTNAPDTPAPAPDRLDPADPVDPVDPTDPSDTADPVEPTNPADPAGHADDAEPTDLAGPADPGSPANSANPTEAANPTHSVEPVDRADLPEAADPTEAGDPVDSADTSDPDVPTDPVEPNSAAIPGDPIEPTDSAGPGGTPHPQDQAGPAETAPAPDPTEPVDTRTSDPAQAGEVGANHDDGPPAGDDTDPGGADTQHPGPDRSDSDHAGPSEEPPVDVDLVADAATTTPLLAVRGHRPGDLLGRHQSEPSPKDAGKARPLYAPTDPWPDGVPAPTRLHPTYADLADITDSFHSRLPEYHDRDAWNRDVDEFCDELIAGDRHGHPPGWALSDSNPRAPLPLDSLDTLFPEHDRSGCRPATPAEPFRHPSEWAQDRNPGHGTDPGRYANCADCARAAELTWRGLDTQAGSRRGLAMGERPEVLGSWSPGDPTRANFGQIADNLDELGPGSSALVAVRWRRGGVSHAFNAFNVDGHIWAVDPQKGIAELWPPSRDGLGYEQLDTDRVQARFIDAEGNHLTAPEIDRVDRIGELRVRLRSLYPSDPPDAVEVDMDLRRKFVSMTLKSLDEQLDALGPSPDIDPRAIDFLRDDVDSARHDLADLMDEVPEDGDRDRHHQAVKDMTRTYADRVQAHIDKLHEFATNPSTPVTLPDQLPWALSRSNPRAPLLVDDVDRLLPGIYDRTDCRPPQVVDPHRPPSEWVTDRNPGGSQDPGLLDREGNCPDCVRASEATWRGLDMQAGANTLPYPHVEPARVLAEWSPGDVVDGDFAAIGDELLRRGPGSSAVVIVDYPDSTSGHAFNAFNDRGDVVAVDGQSGRWEPWPPTQDGLGFSEDDFESVRTILIDADGNHLRIDDLGGDPDVGRPPPDPVPAVDTMGDPPFRVLAGDLVSDRELSTGEQAEAMQAMVEVFENRVFGDGFTTRVGRTWFDPERTRMGFRVDILRNGEEAGAVHQEVTRDNGVLVALQSGVRVHAAFRGQGFATGWNRYLESWYRSSGVDNIRLLAMWDGAYFWARSGYRWTVEREARSILEKLCSHVEAVGGTPGEVSAAQDILDRAKQFPWGHEQFPTVAEIAEIGRLERPGQHLGKQFLTGTGWHGRKDLR